MSADRTPSLTRLSLDDKTEVRRQDSFGSSSDYSIKDKDDSTHVPDSQHSHHHHRWFKRHRSTSEGAVKPSYGTVNLYTHCGRHSNQYLFGGHSLSGSIKEFLRKKE
jgi:hypothetical protein